MRKIISNEEYEKRKQRRARIGGLILLGILVISSIGYSFLGALENKPTNQNSQGIQNLGGSWAVPYGQGYLYFGISPEQAKEISIETNKRIGGYSGKTVYIDSEDSLYPRFVEIIGPYAQRVQPACYGACEKDFPQKNCTDELIVFKQSTNNRVYQNQNCVFIEGNSTTVDAFFYKLLNI